MHPWKPLDVLREFLQRPAEIAMIWPDTSTCARRMAEQVDYAQAQVIVEWGCGTGRVTREILKRKRQTTLYLGFEKNPRFFRHLQRLQGPNVHFIPDDVFRTPLHLQRYGYTKADFLISTLPATLLDAQRLFALAAQIVRYRFVQYQYVTALALGRWLRPHMQRFFPQVRLLFCPWNLPPVVILVGSAARRAPSAVRKQP